MKKLSLEKLKSQFQKAKSKLSKVFKISVPALFIILIIALIVWLLLKRLPGILNPKNNPSPSPINQAQQSPIPQTPQSTSSAATKSASRKGCCTSLSGEPIPYPPIHDCLGEFSTSLTNLDQIVKTVKEQTGLVLGRITTETEFNGYISSNTVNDTVKYTVYLYQADAINNDYTPPYRYKATTCTPELKEKMQKVLNP